MNQMTLSKKNLTPFSKVIPVVEIKTVTWSRDSHNLFDYDNSYYDMKKFILGSSANLIRTQKEISVVEKDDADLPRDDLLLSIDKKANSHDYCISIRQNQLKARADSKTHLVIRSIKEKDGKTQKGYELQAGNVLKFGRVEYRINSIRTGSSAQCLQHISWSNYPEQEWVYDCDILSAIEPESARDVCKYCFSEDISDDPLDNLILKPCDCTGSAGVVHYRCLKDWIKYKVVRKSTNSVTYLQWDQLHCEICLSPFPSKVKFNNALHDFVTLEKPSSPHIVFEKMDPDPKQSSFILVEAPEAEEFTIGRGNSCDVVLKDISISRLHAILKYDGNSFKLYDNESKFGTLVQLDEDIPICANKAAVQIGRTVFTFVMKKMPIGYFGEE